MERFTDGNNSVSDYVRDILQYGIPATVESVLGPTTTRGNFAASTPERVIPEQQISPDRATLTASAANNEKMMLYVGGGLLVLVAVAVVVKVTT